MGNPISHIVSHDLVLIGGGHSHALVIKMWAMNPLPGVRVTLISPHMNTPYSGMLPGLIEGQYEFNETHIDLSRLCQSAGVRFIQDTVTAVDPNKKAITLEHYPDVSYDVASINNGITPDVTLPGAVDFATPVKPISNFYPRWLEFLDQLKEKNAHNDDRFQLVVVGAGAAGVELILAMQQRLANEGLAQRVDCHLVHQSSLPLKGYPQLLRHKLWRLMRGKGIECHASVRVKAIKKSSVVLEHKTLGERDLNSDGVFLCTHAKPSEWLSQSGLSCTKAGFLSVSDTLQTLSHPSVFAVGDTAEQVNHPRPKAGVFAVRQGETLFHNLKAFLHDGVLKEHKPQKAFLSLLSCGGQYALGCRLGSWFPILFGRWVWRWKNHIDRKFMAMFQQLEPMTAAIPPMPSADPQLMRCGGCGAKVGAPVLSRVLEKINPVKKPDVVIGFKDGEDGSVIQPPKNRLLVQSMDQFRGFIDNPFLVGRIAAEHALSDLFAMNALPHSALVSASLPFAKETMVERDLEQLMQGVVHTLNQHNCELLGGHTSEAHELSVGLCVNGFIKSTNISKKKTLKDDHHLVLTQGLGTGTLLAAHQQLMCQGVWLEGAINAMLCSNKKAADIVQRYQASACTDVTGFGLLGHLFEMHGGSEHAKESYRSTLWLNEVPALHGAKETLGQMIYSSLQPQNRRFLQRADIVGACDTQALQLLIDPQTSGGLLAVIPKHLSAQCVEDLQRNGYKQAAIIGSVVLISEDNTDTKNSSPICIQE